MFCSKCGAQVKETDRFCAQCGQDLSSLRYYLEEDDEDEWEDDDADANQNALSDTDSALSEWIHVEKNTGEERVFPILGSELVVPAKLDSFMYYYKSFKNNAGIQLNYVRRDYINEVHDLDQFFAIVPQIYLNYITPLLQNAFEVILAYGLYDITGEDFASQHSKDFCKVNASYETLRTAVNNTLIANEQAVHNRYSSIPSLGFIGGLGTILAVEAANIAIQASYESSLNNIALNPAQKAEILNRLNFEMFMQEFYTDYWNVAYSLCFRLHTHDCGVWYPTAVGNERAEGLMKNLNNGMVPPADRVSAILQVFENRPIQPDLYGYLRSKYPNDEEIEAVCEYFGY